MLAITENLSIAKSQATFTQYFREIIFFCFPLFPVSLEGILRASHGLTHKFTGFFITAEQDGSDARTPPQKYEDDSAMGKFHIVMNAISKFSEKCRNLVTHTSSFPKSDVPVSTQRRALKDFYNLNVSR